jgi:IclR family KDG regulon transcriptional repressor
MSTPVSGTLTKAFDLLKLFGDRQTLTAGECAELLEIPRSTAHRLLNSLVSVEALDHTADGHFCLSLLMFELGSLAPLRRRLCDRGRVPLQKLSEETGMPSNMAVLDRRGCVLIETVPAPGVRVPTRVGHRAPIHSTGLGKLLLAFADPTEREALLQGELAAYTTSTIVNKFVLTKELEKIRERDVAHEFQEIHAGAACIAVPIRDASQNVIAGISISCPSSRFQQRQAYFERCLRAAQINIQRGTSWQGAL